MGWFGGRSAVFVGIVFGLLIGSVNSPAGAHGEAEFSGDIGPYAVQTFEEAVPEAGLLYTVVVRDRGRGLPVRGATVEVTAVGASTSTGPMAANELGDAYQVFIADPERQRWTMIVRIEVPGVEAVGFRHELDPTSQNQGSSREIVVITVTVTIVLVGLLAILGRRARPRDGDGMARASEP